MTIGGMRAPAHGAASRCQVPTCTDRMLPCPPSQVRSRLRDFRVASRRFTVAAVNASGLATPSTYLQANPDAALLALRPPPSSASKYVMAGTDATALAMSSQHGPSHSDKGAAVDAAQAAVPADALPPYNPGSLAQRIDDFDFYPYATARVLRGWCATAVADAPALPLLLRAFLQRVVGTLAFETLSMCLIICNLVLLSIEEYGQSAARTRLLRDGNYALTFMFFVEILMRWGAAGTAYFNINFNRVEFAILVLSVLDVGAQFTGLVTRFRALGGLRASRAMRALRLVRFSNAWSGVLGQIAGQIPAALYACVVMIVFMFSFATLGMQVFGPRYDGAVAVGLWDSVPLLNFQSLYWGMVTVYQVSVSVMRREE